MVLRCIVCIEPDCAFTVLLEMPSASIKLLSTLTARAACSPSSLATLRKAVILSPSVQSHQRPLVVPPSDPVCSAVVVG